MSPRRIRRRRTARWRMPEGVVYVGRPGPWGNPFEVGSRFVRVDGLPQRTLFRADAPKVATAAEAVELYREWLAHEPEKIATARGVLRGYHLACWCPLEQPCHADVLLEVANVAPSTLGET